MKEPYPTNILAMTLIRCGGLPLAAWEPMACGIPDWDSWTLAEARAAQALRSAFDEALAHLPEGDLRTLVYNARKNFFQRGKKPTQTTIIAISEGKGMDKLGQALESWEQVLSQKQAVEMVFEQRLADNYRILQHLAQDENLRRALLFASHDLLAGLERFAQKNRSELDKKDRRTALSLLQYLTRAVFKTSPLGRFTTVQIQALSPKTTQDDGVGEWFDSKISVSPNVAILPAIYAVLLREPAFFQSLRVSLNPCIPHSEPGQDGQVSDAQWLYFDGEREAFQQTEPNPVADFLVKTLLENQGEMPFLQIIEVLETAVDATPEQLQHLVVQWIDRGLLEWQLPERGLSPQWCGALYQYLGYLPSSNLLTETAYLLQWLRTSARTIPFQSVAEAQALQRAAHHQIKSFLEKHGGEMPPIPAEQVFFEDVAKDCPLHLPPGTMESLVGQLNECWQQKAEQMLPTLRARVLEFAENAIPVDGQVDFLTFGRQFLNHKPSGKRMSMPRHRGKVGAVVQIFQENGAYKAVLNALYPGGGKLFARWLSLFPANVAEEIKAWQASEERIVAAFPWQGWSNANFQPPVGQVALCVPDARAGQGRKILLADLAVRKNELGFPQLIEKQSNKPLFFNDLGLEAPESRPPMMQLLWTLGVPYVAADAMMPEGFGWVQAGGIRHRRRTEFRSLVLARAAWELPEQVWRTLFLRASSQAEQMGRAVSMLKKWGIPDRFFAQFTAERAKPQFFDTSSPLSMVLLGKKLRDGSGALLLSEMLPEPSQWLGDRAMEFVLEFDAN